MWLDKIQLFSWEGAYKNAGKAACIFGADCILGRVDGAVVAGGAVSAAVAAAVYPGPGPGGAGGACHCLVPPADGPEAGIHGGSGDHRRYGGHSGAGGRHRVAADPPGGGAADAPAHPAGRAAGNDCRPAAAAGRLLCRLPPGTAGLAGGDPRPAGDPGGGAGGAGQRGVHYSGGGSGGGFARGVPVLRHHGPGGVFHHRQLSPDHGLLPPPAGNAAGQGPGCQGESPVHPGEMVPGPGHSAGGHVL